MCLLAAFFRWYRYRHTRCGAVELPDSFVAIAEQHTVTLAAGMACEGLKPVVALYSTFLQRGYDQLIHDVALQNLDGTFGMERAGMVGQDGPTHHGAFDLSFLCCIPNMVIGAPSDENECRQILYIAFEHENSPDKPVLSALDAPH